MDLQDAKTLAELHMEEHLDSSWTFRFDNAVKRFGVCKYSRREIGLSRKLVLANNMERVEKTILHEIAHAIVGPNHGHSIVWERKCIEIGGNGERCYSESNTKIVQSKYTLKCNTCDTEIGRERITARAKRVACADCCNKYNGGKYSDKYLFSVYQNY